MVFNNYEEHFNNCKQTFGVLKISQRVFRDPNLMHLGPIWASKSATEWASSLLLGSP